MDAETLTALKGSITKWRAIVDGTGEDRGVDNCPLCQKFYEPIDGSEAHDEDGDEYDIWCVGCPVSAWTKDTNCHGSPWPAWRRLFSSARSFPFRAETLEQKAAARAELDFLVSLLPAEE